MQLTPDIRMALGALEGASFLKQALFAQVVLEGKWEVKDKRVPRSEKLERGRELRGKGYR